MSVMNKGLIISNRKVKEGNAISTVNIPATV